MLLKAECIPCTLNMAIKAISSLIPDDASAAQTFTSRILNIPALRGLDWNITAPGVVEFIIQDIVALTQNPDPFQALKTEQNSKAMKLYPWLKDLVTSASDPLYTAVNLAILGNSIDAMKYQESINMKLMIQERLNSKISKRTFSQFRDKITHSNLIVYFGDNCGEAVFDKVLIETLKEHNKQLEINFIVRSFPTLNDVTLKESRIVGIDKITSIIENGIDAPLPGTVLSRCSNEVQKLVQEADLVIYKGGGNFDSLDEEQSLKDTSFMLLAKCMPYCRQFKAKLNEPVLENRYSD